MSGILMFTTGVTNTFVPLSHTYTTGSGSETVPSGATTAVIETWGGGGGGRFSLATGNAYGGGGGAYCTATFSVAPADWGTTLAYFVGNGGAAKTTASNGGAGTFSQITGTLNSVSVGVLANGGGGGTGLTGGSAGGGSGGSVANGTSGSIFQGGNSGGGALGGGEGSDGDIIGGGGGGENSSSGSISGAGARGQAKFSWS